MTRFKSLSGAIYGLFFALALLALAGCGGADPVGNVQQGPVRAARPTFTPTVALQQETLNSSNQQPSADSSSQNQSANAGSAANPTPEAVAPTPTSANKAIVVITEELVNARNGPGLNYSLVDTVERGEQFDIVGKTPDGGWWQVCCVNDQQVWVINQYVDTDGDVNSVAVVNDLPAVDGVQPAVAPTAVPPVITPVTANQPAVAQPTATSAPAATPLPAATQPPAFGFDLVVQESFPEPSLMRIFLYVFQGSQALTGYQLRVVHNGTALDTGSQVSNGPLPELTWPFSDGRQRLQNLKIEFPGEQPGGNWEVQLIQNGQPVGPVATFNLSDNEPDRELYVRYQKK